MSEKIECKIIQDLLPNYIEKLTMEETTMYIEEHLGECKECKRSLEYMQNDAISLNFEKTNEKEIKYLKKIHNKMENLKRVLILLIIIIIYLLVDRMFL